MVSEMLPVVLEIETRIEVGGSFKNNVILGLSISYFFPIDDKNDINIFYFLDQVMILVYQYYSCLFALDYSGLHI